MISDKCPYCRAGIAGCDFMYGNMKCRSCGGRFTTPLDVFSAQKFSEATVNGLPILQVYDDPSDGLSVISLNNQGEYVYGRGYNPHTGLWMAGTYAPSITMLASKVCGPLVLDNARLGDIRTLQGAVASKARKIGRMR